MDKTPEKQTEQQSAECHPKDRAGEIHLILGSMYSGKTTEIIRRYKKYSRTDKKCLLIRFAEDIRYDKTKLCTHDLYKMDAMSETLIANIYEKIITEHYEVVCIDEGQFFVDIVQFAEVLANCGVIVIISGLDGN